MPSDTVKSTPEEIQARLRAVLTEASRRVAEDPVYYARILANWEKGRQIGN